MGLKFFIKRNTFAFYANIEPLIVGLKIKLRALLPECELQQKRVRLRKGGIDSKYV